MRFGCRIASYLVGSVLFCKAQSVSEVERPISFSYSAAKPKQSNEDVRLAIGAANVIFGSCHLRLILHATQFQDVVFDLWPSGTIATDFEATRMQGRTHTEVLLVNKIDGQACGHGQEEGPGRILGCAYFTFIAVVRDQRTMGFTLAHEFGHRSGLAHRNVTGALMNPVYQGGVGTLDDWERRQLRNPNDNPPRPKNKK